MINTVLTPAQIIPADIMSMLASGAIGLNEAHRRIGGSKSNFFRRIAKNVKAGVAPTSVLRFATVKTEYDRLGTVHAAVETGKASGNSDRVVAAEARAREAEKRLRDMTSLNAILAGISSIPVRPEPLWLSEQKTSEDESVPILVLTDWHLGERVDPAQTGGYAFDVAIAKSRISQTVDRTIAMTRRHLAGLRYPGIVVALGGDMVSGGIHSELAETDELSLIASVITARDVLVSAITRLADEFGQVFVPTALGNHGRFMDRKPRAKGYAERNADFLIYEFLGQAFKDDPRVHIVNPAAGETIFSVYGRNFLLTHGDRIGAKGGDGIIGPIGPITRGSFKTANSLESLGVPVDHIVMGHWHRSIFLPNTTVCGSLKGPDEYALRMLRVPAEDPSQTLIVVHPEHGITFRQPIFLKDDACPDKGARRDAGKGWCSVFSDAA